MVDVYFGLTMASLWCVLSLIGIVCRGVNQDLMGSIILAVFVICANIWTAVVWLNG